jgi:DNA invertase Pin-like site-specific DNA recombinase
MRGVGAETMSARQAERALIRWRQATEQRDALVRQAHAAGLTINRIHTLTGIGRGTIYRILDAGRTG